MLSHTVGTDKKIVPSILAEFLIVIVSHPKTCPNFEALFALIPVNNHKGSLLEKNNVDAIIRKNNSKSTSQLQSSPDLEPCALPSELNFAPGVELRVEEVKKISIITQEKKVLWRWSKYCSQYPLVCDGYLKCHTFFVFFLSLVSFLSIFFQFLEIK